MVTTIMFCPMNYIKLCIKWTVCLLSCVCITFSCGNSWEKEIEKLIGQEVIFPTKMFGYVSGEFVTVDIKQKLLDSRGMVVSVYSEVECKSCLAEKIPDMAMLIKEVVGDAPVLFVFPMSVGKELQTISKLTPDVHCMFDMNFEFTESNPFIPKQEMLQTWLVDNSSHIVVCGNPSLNEKVSELYKQALK